ncbi:MAG: peptidoglycan bridge formation glycyltransferase FemA/FemB family protein [Clostridia bacterium]|nr:peptidoglycan bridge formation glycyltransferase FemA/FemB family protein [Clostridia bacterium]
MKLETVTIEQAAEFDAFVRSHPKGHMMQTSAWGRVKKEWDWRGFLLRGEDSAVRGACAVLLRQIPMTPFRLMYAPRGPVCDLHDADTVRELLLAVKEYGLRNKAYTFKIDTDTLVTDNAYIDQLKDLGFTFKEHGAGFDTIQARYIFRLDVGGKTEEEVMAGFHPKTRYNTRLAGRKGVTVEIKGREACAEFHDLMLVTGARDGFATRDTAYFERIMDAFGDDARIYLAKYEGKTIAGALDVHCGDKVWYVYGASSNEYRNVMPNYLVQWEMIRWAIAEGCRWYDFRGGYPDEDNPLHGIFKFKKGFCNDYMELMGEADLILDKVGYKAVGTAEKLRKSTRGLRAKLINRK